MSETVQKAAKMTGVPVIGTNPIGEITRGPWTGMMYGGSSVAADKSGNIIATGKDRDILVTVIAY